MNDERTAPTSAAQERASVADTAPMALLILMFLGSCILAVATDAVPIDDKSLAFGPLFYGVTVVGGLVVSFFGFHLLEVVLRRREHPARGWSRAAVAVLAAVCVLFVVACWFEVPMVALGFAVNGIGIGVAMVWSARAPETAPRAYGALLWASLALAFVAAVWTAIAIQGAIG